MNQAALLSLVVPVLPAAGRPMDALAPVRPWPGPSMTPRRMPVRVFATSGSRTWLHGSCLSSTGLPFPSVMDVTGFGGQNRPWFANVAYAADIASGLTVAAEPSTNEARPRGSG